ncbi:MAG: ABC transporter ATP-binding protein [Chloroflexia bacterium]|nr:ABC transporter ATP-binding protein [Chloroflexia bacterium]
MNAIAVTKLAVPLSPIRDVSLHIPEHCCYGIIGASGSGKSALLNAIAGLHGTQSPHIRMGTQSVNTTTAQIGIVSPRIQPPAHLTVHQLLVTHAALYGIAGSTLTTHYARAMRWCAIEPLASKYIRQLSLFDVRRVMLACALINRPALLLIDEPTVGLYAHEQHVMIDIIENLRDREMTIVIATRGDAPLESLFDMIGVLADGRIISELDAQQIRTLPRTIMIRTNDIPTAAFEYIITLDPSIVATRRNIVLTGTGVAALAQILQTLLHYNVHIFRIEPRNHPLSDLVNQSAMPHVLAKIYPPRNITSEIGDGPTSFMEQ